MANEVAVTFEDMLSDKLTMVSNALPKDFNKERFVQNAIAVCEEKPELKKANRMQLMVGMLKGAYLGLDFMNKECYLITYGNSVQFQTDYKGECKFVKKYAIRKVSDIYARVVREGDFFEEAIVDSRPQINFKPKPFNNGEIMGAFAVVIYADGGIDYETMSTADINAVRNNYSKASNSKAWKFSFDEMAKKTVLRRLCKHIETDFESQEARQAWDEGSGMNFVQAEKNPDELVDVFNQEKKNEEIIVEGTEVAQDVPEDLEVPEWMN